ncbi:hemolysin family protein [Paenibacillus tarimensis]
MLLFNLFLVAVLILFTAFFVATEFAIVKMRPSRVDQLVQEGRNKAVNVEKVTGNLDGYLSACQLGITITALGLGWLGEPTIEELLHPVFNYAGMGEPYISVVSFVAAFAAVTFLHVVLGELAPKSVAIQKAEQVSLWFSGPIILFYKLMYPFIWILNGSANALVKMFGFKPIKEHEEAHSEEEIRIIMTESYESGKINKTELGYVSRIFTFDNLLAREIMVPRTDMVCLYTNKSLEENMKIIKREQYTRFPVAKENKDNIIGFINTKQFFLRYDNNPEFDIKSLLLPPLMVPEVMPVKSLLKRMQAEQVHIALLFDEYGGTSGIITIEDILEEIVGEIRDEFDKDEEKEVEMISPDHYIVEGRVLLSEIGEIMNLNLVHEEIDTIGGWIYSMNPDIKAGESIVHDDVTYIVLEKTHHRIRKIEIKR